MQFEETFDFDSNVSALMGLFTDNAYYHEKYRRIGSRQPEFLDSKLADGRFEIRMRHELATADLPLPEFVRKRIGDHIDLYQTDGWDVKECSGRTDIKLHSGLLDIGIDLNLRDRVGGSQLALAFDIRANMAMFGHKLEQGVADNITKRMHRELEETDRMASEWSD